MFDCEEGFLECECGKVHQVTTKNIVVDLMAFDELLKAVESSGYKKILVLSSLGDRELIDKFKQEFSADFELNIVYLTECKATLLNADNLEDKRQQLVVALGSEELVSLAKYYAYAYESELFIYPVGNFTDFTFSKYSRLYDGVQFNFYETVEPSQIFVSLKDNPYNIYQSYYISSKYIALFDDIVSEYVYETRLCDRLKAFIKNSLAEYIKFKPQDDKALNYKNIWMLIRLGQAMSFYGETKAFFGGDKGITDLMQALKYGSDFLELSTLSLKLVINSYSCFFESSPAKSSANLNKHIMGLSSLLKVTPTEIMKRLVDSTLLMADDHIYKRFNNYYPYLKGVLSKVLAKVFMLHSSLNLSTNILKKYKLDSRTIEKAYAHSPCLFSKPTTIHLLFSMGYLDKLL